MSYEILGLVGDCNPLQYGGWLVGSSPEHVDAIVIEPIEDEDKGKQGEGIDCYTYRVALDRMKTVSDLATRSECLIDFGYDNSWVGSPADRSEWFDTAEFRRNIENSGIGWDNFVEAICSENAVERAWAWVEVAGYFGIHELDYEPIRVTESELRKRFALPFYRARKRGIRVFV